MTSAGHIIQESPVSHRIQPAADTFGDTRKGNLDFPASINDCQDEPVICTAAAWSISDQIDALRIGERPDDVSPDAMRNFLNGTVQGAERLADAVQSLRIQDRHTHKAAIDQIKAMLFEALGTLMTGVYDQEHTAGQHLRTAQHVSETRFFDPLHSRNGGAELATA